MDSPHHVLQVNQADSPAHGHPYDRSLDHLLNRRISLADSQAVNHRGVQLSVRPETPRLSRHVNQVNNLVVNRHDNL